MATTIYLHIGVHKTGTTSIQQTMKRQREMLLGHDINYLGMRENHGAVFLSLLSDAPERYRRNVDKRNDTPEKAAAYNERNEQELLELLSANRSSKLLISGEGLSLLPPASVAKMKEILDPYADAYRIIVYVRDPYEFTSSSLQQHFKAGYALDDPNLPLTLPRYRQKIDKYIRLFGRENVDIRIFDPKRFVGGNLLTDFLTAMGAPELGPSLALPYANQSMSHESALVLSETNKAIPTRVDELANRKRILRFHLTLAAIQGERFSVDPSVYANHMDEIRADMDWLHEIIGEPVFAQAKPRPASVPRWSEATVASIKKLVGELADRLREAQEESSEPVRQPSLPASLEWLRDSLDPAKRDRTLAVAPQFDQTTIRDLGCFIHAMKLATRRFDAERRRMASQEEAA